MSTRLVVHDWGVVALIAAQEEPQRVRRLVIVNAVPLLPGYRWHRTARIWRTRGLGELVQPALDQATSSTAGCASRAATGAGTTPPSSTMIWQHLDRGTEAAILRLYRSADPDRLAAAGERLGSLSSCPALVVWGLRDRYLPARFGAAYAAAPARGGAGRAPRGGALALDRRPGVVDRAWSASSNPTKGSPSGDESVDHECDLTRILRSCAALIDRIGRWLPHGYGDAARQLSLFVVAELCYEAVRGIADGAAHDGDRERRST